MNTATDPVSGHGGTLLPLLDWVSRQPDAVEVELACSEHPDPGRGPRGPTVVVVPACLTELARYELLELLVVGAASVTAAVGGCTDPQLLRERCAPLLALLDRLGHADRLRLRDSSGRGRRRPVLSATSMPVSRRQLFLLPEAARRPLPDADDTAHRRLVAAVRALADGAPEAAETEPHVPDAPALRLTSEGCTACGVCVQACPEQALALEDGAGAAGTETGPAANESGSGAETTLWLQASSCSGCRACIDLCPTDALSAHGHEDWDALLDDRWTALESVTTIRCRRCNGRFPAGDGQLCPPCRFRSAEPFGTTLPDAVLRRLGPDMARRLSAGPR